MESDSEAEWQPRGGRAALPRAARKSESDSEFTSASPLKSGSKSELVAEWESKPAAKFESESSRESESESAADSYSESDLESGSESPLQMLPTPSPQQHRLNSKGYLILYEYFSAKLCKRLRTFAESLKKSSWSRLIGDGGKTDNFRWSTPAPKKLAQKVYTEIREGCQTFFPHSKARKWIFIKSLPGGKPQPAHQDFLPLPRKADFYNYSSIPASVIIWLQNDSFIYGYGWNRRVALEADKEKITFDEGDVVMFRGDFFHGGGDYTTTNVRMHVFLEPEGKKKLQKKNSVTLVRVIPKKIPPKEWRQRDCLACGQSFHSGAAARKHTRDDHNFHFIKYPKHIKQPSCSGAAVDCSVEEDLVGLSESLKQVVYLGVLIQRTGTSVRQ